MGATCCIPSEEHDDTTHAPHLALKVIFSSVDTNHANATQHSSFDVGDEVAITRLENLQTLRPLLLRHSGSNDKHDNGTSSYAKGSSTAVASRPSNLQQGSQHVLRAAVMSSNGEGGFHMCHCLMKLALTPKERQSEEMARTAVEDCTIVTSYAYQFNSLIRSKPDGENMPAIKVAASVCCSVLYSQLPFLSKGDHVHLMSYPEAEVHKFVFNGREEFMELPHALFHYVVSMSRGSLMATDLQGFQHDNGDVLLVDPALQRAPAFNVGNVLASVTTGNRREGSSNEFEQLHPKCGPLCKAFDPYRRGVTAHTICGVGTGSCF